MSTPLMIIMFLCQLAAQTPCVSQPKLMVVDENVTKEYYYLTFLKARKKNNKFARKLLFSISVLFLISKTYKKFWFSRKYFSFLLYLIGI
jgi:hypothetical protein